MLQNPARHDGGLGVRGLEVLSLQPLISRGEQRLLEDIGARPENHPNENSRAFFFLAFDEPTTKKPTEKLFRTLIKEMKPTPLGTFQ